MPGLPTAEFWKLSIRVNYQDEDIESNRGNDYGWSEKYYFSSPLT